MRAIAVAGTFALLTLSNCDNDVCGCPPMPIPAQVTGRVTQEGNSSEVAGTVVRAYSAPGTNCTSLWEDYGNIQTSGDGSFLMFLPSMAYQENACVFVFARPPQGSSGLRNSDTVLVILDFDPSNMDSTRVDLVLRATT